MEKTDHKKKRTTEYGEPVDVNVVLKNPKRTLVMSCVAIRFNSNDGKEVGSIAVDIVGRGARVTVDGENYDLDFTDLWNQVVTKLGKKEYIIDRTKSEK